MLKDFCYPAVYEVDENGFSLYFPDLDEAYTCADSKQLLWRRAREVLELAIEGRIEDNEKIPNPTDIEILKLEKGQKVVLINVSVKASLKYVKKTLTIPEHLNIKALNADINFSKLLTESIEKELKKINS
ncbi:MAG: type II toxin-antitoxin system HicB family antitoxin [Fusobacteriaceae bacterium]|nr:type II toxin-antitoxin system HicB family antitoxin [Fusobacteriaceae bacterium]